MTQRQRENEKKGEAAMVFNFLKLFSKEQTVLNLSIM